MNATKPLLTVVVPAYNAEKYLEECLDSLLNQTVTDHRVIVVNDGSGDSTGDIGRRYAQAHPERIVYTEHENKGLGAARNTGLAMVDTEYVAFLDSDDWWDVLFVEKLKRELQRHEERPDLIFSLPWIYDTVTKKMLPWYDKETFDAIFYPDSHDGNAASRQINARTEHRILGLEPNACRRIYRTQFVKDAGFRFPVGVKWEDVQPHFYLLHRAKRCIGLRSTGFIYRINTGGQITADGGASRMDIISVFRSTFQMAMDEAWAEYEIRYILKMIGKFTTWSIGVTNAEYMIPLLDQLHGFFKRIPLRDICAYKNINVVRRRDLAVMLFLRSPLYRCLSDYRTRQKVMDLTAKLRRGRDTAGRK